MKRIEPRNKIEEILKYGEEYIRNLEEHTDTIINNDNLKKTKDNFTIDLPSRNTSFENSYMEVSQKWHFFDTEKNGVIRVKSIRRSKILSDMMKNKPNVMKLSLKNHNANAQSHVKSYS